MGGDMQEYDLDSEELPRIGVFPISSRTVEDVMNGTQESILSISQMLELVINGSASIKDIETAEAFLTVV